MKISTELNDENLIVVDKGLYFEVVTLNGMFLAQATDDHSCPLWCGASRMFIGKNLDADFVWISQAEHERRVRAFNDAGYTGEQQF